MIIKPPPGKDGPARQGWRDRKISGLGLGKSMVAMASKLVAEVTEMTMGQVIYFAQWCVTGSGCTLAG
jgi:hypothetical protein